MGSVFSKKYSDRNYDIFKANKNENVIVKIKDEYKKRPPIDAIPSLLITLTILQCGYKEDGFDIFQ